QNPWRKGNPVVDTSIQRALFPQIFKDINNPEITVLTGSRQVGKTTLLKSMISRLLTDGVSSDAIFYFNLDDIHLISYFSEYTDFLEFIASEHSGFSYIFIDEAQRLENPGIFLKLIYDLGPNMKPDMKIIVSGSSALELKTKTTEHLTGRKHTFELYPFSFEEFLKHHHADYFFTKPISTLTKFHAMTIESLLDKFILSGGYPKPLTAVTFENKLIEIKEIYDSYIKKDVKDFLNVENTGGYNNLIKALAMQTGNLINYNELSLVSGLNVATVKKYMDFLEGTYIFKRVLPWFTNARKEISKAPKIYGYDTGLLNYITNNFHKDAKHKDAKASGNMIENFVCCELIKKGLDIKYWRTGSGAEVDFIINGLPLEVKSTNLKKTTLSKSFISYCKKYHPATGILFNQSLYAERSIEDTRVHFFPLWAVPLVLKNLFNA
ncbi:MAG: ATP-binding protein, partial [Thermodesulfobacteriota bacterium]|nr:ATP-binding protein [Thermodesulfobacteriota bacterium]